MSNEEEYYIVRCGHPKANGEPCKIVRHGYGTFISDDVTKRLVEEFGGPACNNHETPENTKLWQLIWDTIMSAVDTGRRSGRESGRSEVLSEQRADARKAERAANFRLHDTDGSQIVEVGSYSYKWHGEPLLQVGDSVILPGNWFNSNTRKAEVTALGSSYTGELTSVLRRA